jgi:hypothetical protein
MLILLSVCCVQQTAENKCFLRNPSKRVSPEGFVQAQPLHGEEYQLYDRETQTWSIDPKSETLAEIDACKTELSEIDKETSSRVIRAASLAAAKASKVTGEDYNRLLEYEARAETLRGRIKELYLWVNEPPQGKPCGILNLQALF